MLSIEFPTRENRGALRSHMIQTKTVGTSSFVLHVSEPACWVISQENRAPEQLVLFLTEDAQCWIASGCS